MPKLAELFQASQGQPVEWDGQRVHMMYELSVPTDDAGAAAGALRVEFGEFSPARPQALRLKVRGGQLDVGGQRLSDIVLWSDSAPEVVAAGIHPSRRGTPVVIRAWNAWRDEAGTTQAWVGNSGILVREDPTGAVTLRCSDGYDDPTFADLTATLRIVPAGGVAAEAGADGPGGGAADGAGAGGAGAASA